MTNPPLARRLGDATHVSPLLHKIGQMSGCPEDRVGNGCSNVRLAAEPATTNAISQRISLPTILSWVMKRSRWLCVSASTHTIRRLSGPLLNC